MIEVNKLRKEEVKDAIVKAANIIIQKSDELSSDIDKLNVSGISIWINFDPGCAPKLDITTSYTP